ncbi:TolC family protein, partial [Phenylobacterium conjunctum]
RAARAGRDAAREGLREGVIAAWSELETARLMLSASRDRATAAASALDSVRNEVRVGQKPTLDLLNAERDRLAADAAVILEEGRVVAAASRLNGLIRGA